MEEGWGSSVHERGKKIKIKGGKGRKRRYFSPSYLISNNRQVVI
jgi:hypothetical protein